LLDINLAVKTHQYHSNMGESVVSLAYVAEAGVVKQNFLQDKGGDSLAKLRAALHDSQAQRNNLGGEQEGDDFLLIGLDQSTDDTQRCESQVLEGASLAHGVEEWIEKQRKVGLQERRPGFWVTGHALQKG
jgi:hypothetical protein